MRTTELPVERTRGQRDADGRLRSRATREGSLYRGAIAVAALAMLVACRPGRPPAEPPAPASGESTNASRWRDAPHLLLVSFDGFRHDYQDRFETPNFDRLERKGVRADGLVSVYPSKTFPAHYTLVTGLHPDRHGLVSNTFHDPERDRTYRISDRTEVADGSWYGGEPLWSTAEREGMVAASYFWVGAEAEIAGEKPTYAQAYDESVSNDRRIEGVLEWLHLDDAHRPHFVTLYFSLVDDAGHALGPESPRMAEAVGEADRLLGRILDGVAALPDGRRVYVVVVSDHGMAEVSSRQALDPTALPDVQVVETGAHVSLRVPDGPGGPRSEQVRNALREMLPGARVRLRSEIPARLRHTANRRIGDVEVEAEPGTLIVTSTPAGPERPLGGAHGYDPRLPDMLGIFLASGPGIPRGRRIPPVEMIHLHPWMSALLGLEIPDGLDGRLEVLQRLLGVPERR